MRLAACCIVSWPNDPSMSEEEEEEEEQEPKLLTTDTEWGEESEGEAGQVDQEEEMDRQQGSQDW